MDPEIDIIQSKVQGDIGFHFKVRGSAARYWVAPARWPAQPRLWCFRVARCLPGGLVDASERPWIGAAGMTREELPAASQAIRADIGAWLAQTANQELRRWILEQTPSQTAPAERAAQPVASHGGRSRQYSPSLIEHAPEGD